MITTTHVVANALLARRWPGRFESPTSFVVGGLAPDIGLTLMAAGAAVVLPRTRGMTRQEAMKYGFEELFFTSKPWIAASNVLHSPVVAGALAVASYAAPAPIGRRMRSFALGTAVHIAMDVPVHVHDGPVLLWPLNWTYRFQSRVSYYDPKHYGRWVAPIDLAITLVGAASLLRGMIHRT